MSEVVDFTVKNQDLINFITKASAKGIITVSATEKIAATFFKRFFIEAIEDRLEIKALDTQGGTMWAWHVLSGVDVEIEGKFGVTDSEILLELLKSITGGRKINFYYEEDKPLTITTADEGTFKGFELREWATITPKELEEYNSTIVAFMNAHTFDEDNVPGLAFAARSTSSFPGAFPPSQLGDVDVALHRRGQDWPGRDRFMRRNFPSLTNGKDPKILSFIDGAVVNNKPFSAAIDALGDRSAQREVDRRIVYIDPVPEDLSIDESETSPGFFRSIIASLSEIPRNEPINDELNWVNAHNRQSRRLRSVMASVKTEVDDIIDSLILEGQSDFPSVALVASWRERVNVVSKEQAGYSYTSYSHTKTYAVLDRTAQLICELCMAAGYDTTTGSLIDLLHNWGRRKNILSDTTEDAEAVALEEYAPVDVQALIGFLREFDVDFRMRRLRFVISALNETYQSAAARRSATVDPHQLNTMKRKIYVFIDQLKDRWNTDAYIENARTEIVGLGNAIGNGQESEVLAALDVLLRRLSGLMALEDRDFDYDLAMSDHIGAIVDRPIRQELFRAYIGFPFFDVLTLPILQTMDMTELEPIRVDRISPEDCKTIRQGGAEEILKGIGFARFAAFFSRADRENDYLWGRLNSAERLVDFIVNSARHSNMSVGLDITEFKKRLFLAVLKAERPHLLVSGTLLDQLEKEIKAIG